MSLRAVIDSVEGREKRLTVFDPPTDDAVAELREYFASQAVRIEEGTTDSDLSGYVVLSDERDDEVLAAVDLGRLGGDVTVGPGEQSAFAPILEHLDETTFTSYDLPQMMAATREMEDRAWRAGTGELHAGFQRVGAIRAQKGVYEDLASKDIDVHAYCAPSDETPAIEDVTLHEEDTEEIRTSWFVAFDGAGDPSEACLLLAEERGDPAERQFYGFWSYDPSVVATVIDHLHETYAVPA
ncbi:DICT sensory domain-containing protein [Halobaculum gomorrense]|uniref:DICT domain-containing protein n=1 Tax=Halobaculum gomorrense TaxID=43928 RepID=A0A1M5N573_9EURY|nr:DICT sensory domain-containing protein [Halobaculum gomorrense]SHG84661.1 DICT domain-containing protein [Halobaculum gomorrense]